jgi:hypothetical protein
MYAQNKVLNATDSARTRKELILRPHSRQVSVVKMPNTTVTANSAAASCEALTMLDGTSLLSIRTIISQNKE